MGRQSRPIEEIISACSETRHTVISSGVKDPTNPVAPVATAETPGAACAAAAGSGVRLFGAAARAAPIWMANDPYNAMLERVITHS